MAPPNSNHWESDPEYIELMKFLIEKTKDVESPMSMNGLAREFKEKSGSSLSATCLSQRIGIFRQKIHEMDAIDMTAKVRMLVALGASIDMDFLNELRKDALVEVDDYNRITKYRANDGSLEMGGDHSHSAKMKEKQKRRRTGCENRDEDSDGEAMDPISKTPGSTKRAAVAEVPRSSKKTRNSSLDRFIKKEDYLEDDLPSVPESRAREVVRQVSPQLPSPRTQQCREPKQQEAPEISDSHTRQEAPGDAPKTPGAQIPRAIPIKTESGANDAYTPQVKFLEAIQFIVLNLDMSSLSPVQAKIEQKLLESSNKKIPNDEMILAMEMMVAKITNKSVSILPQIVETVSLKVFLCYLKAAILNSKLEGLEVLMEKVKERINEPASNDKNIPVDKVVSVLQYTLDGI